MPDPEPQRPVYLSRSLQAAHRSEATCWTRLISEHQTAVRFADGPPSRTTKTPYLSGGKRSCRWNLPLKLGSARSRSPACYRTSRGGAACSIESIKRGDDTTEAQIEHIGERRTPPCHNVLFGAFEYIGALPSSIMDCLGDRREGLLDWKGPREILAKSRRKRWTS